MSPLTSEVGAEFRRYGAARHLLTALAFLVVAVDLSNQLAYQSWWRCAPPVLLIAVFGFATRWHLRSMGLILTPRQGWPYWFGLSIKLGFAMFFLLAVYLVLIRSRGYDPTVFPMSDRRFVFCWLVSSCVFYPLVEEGVYRLAFCTPTVASLGAWPTVALSGVAFGVLHLCYGNVAPENLIGGFILAWAYLKSESILVPLLLHSLGNLCVVMAHLAYFYCRAI